MPSRSRRPYNTTEAALDFEVITYIFGFEYRGGAGTRQAALDFEGVMYIIALGVGEWCKDTLFLLIIQMRAAAYRCRVKIVLPVYLLSAQYKD